MSRHDSLLPGYIVRWDQLIGFLWRKHTEVWWRTTWRDTPEATRRIYAIAQELRAEEGVRPPVIDRWKHEI